MPISPRSSASPLKGSSQQDFEEKSASTASKGSSKQSFGNFAENSMKNSESNATADAGSRLSKTSASKSANDTVSENSSFLSTMSKHFRKMDVHAAPKKQRPSPSTTSLINQPSKTLVAIKETETAASPVVPLEQSKSKTQDEKTVQNQRRRVLVGRRRTYKSPASRSPDVSTSAKEGVGPRRKIYLVPHGLRKPTTLQHTKPIRNVPKSKVNIQSNSNPPPTLIVPKAKSAHTKRKINSVRLTTQSEAAIIEKLTKQFAGAIKKSVSLMATTKAVENLTKQRRARVVSTDPIVNNAKRQ